MQCRRPWFDSWVRKICCRRDKLRTPVFLGFPGGSAGKESACNAGDLGSIPGLGRSPGEGKGYPLQYSGLENSMDCVACGVTELDMTDFHLHFSYSCSVFLWKLESSLRSFHLSMTSHTLCETSLSAEREAFSHCAWSSQMDAPSWERPSVASCHVFGGSAHTYASLSLSQPANCWKLGLLRYVLYLQYAWLGSGPPIWLTPINLMSGKEAEK